MVITSLTLSSDKKKLILNISDASDIISLRLWDHDTYKDFSKLVDLSGKLTGATNEVIEITPIDINQTSFSGLYFIEAEDITETSLEFIGILNKYKECLLNKTLFYDECEECIDEVDVNIININSMVMGLEYAIELRAIVDMITIIKALNKYCKDDCKSCGEQVDISDYENNNPDNINIILDGESLD